MATIKLALVDDELMSRNTIKKYLEGNGTYEIAADFQNGKMALEWLRKNSIDILLCDMQMPEMDGVELMRNVHILSMNTCQLSQSAALMILTMCGGA